MYAPRRVVTGLDAQGRSCILIDGQASTVIWSTDDTPADNSGTADAGGAVFSFPDGTGTVFMYHDFEPGSEAFMHASDTIDYVVVITGEVILVTETGETSLAAGDVVVDRGVIHGWRNDGNLPCRVMTIGIAALPVGDGATLSGKVTTT